MSRQSTAVDPTTMTPFQGKWWWDRRVGLTPIYAGVFACLCSALAQLLTPAQTFVTALVSGGAAAVGAHLRWGTKKDKGMRTFVWIVIVAFMTFVLLVRNQIIEMRWVFIGLLVCILVLGLFWWTDNYNKHRVHVEKDMQRWPILAEKLGMPRVKRGQVKKTDTGRKWHFWWDNGDYTLGAFIAQARSLESALGIPLNRIRFENVYSSPGMKEPNAIVVTENTDSAILRAPVAFDQPSMRAITDPMFVGMREDNTKHEVVWYETGFGGKHTLAAGATRSGKSGLYHLVLAESAYCPDLVRWGIDAKQGMALRPWASLFDWMIDDVDDSVWMLQAVQEVLKARSKYAADHGWDVWRPDAEHPILVLFVDEAAEVFGLSNFDANSLASSIGRMGAGAGVLLLLATQHPTNEALGSTQLTKNINRRFCFSVEDSNGQRAVIPGSLDRFDASEIPIGKAFAGTYYSSDGGLISELSGRVRYITPCDVFRIVQEVGHDASKAVPDLDEISEAAAIAGSVDPGTGICHYQDRRIWTVEDAIKPDDWVGDNTDDITEDRVEVVNPDAPNGAPKHEPAGAPVHPSAPNDAPMHPVHLPPDPPRPPDLHVVAMGVPPSPTDDGTTERKDGTPMNLATVTEPQTPAEEAELTRRIAEYGRQFFDGDISPEQAVRMLGTLLDQAPAGGITIASMRQTLGRSPSWYSEQLRDGIRNGTVRKLGLGFYARPIASATSANK